VRSDENALWSLAPHDVSVALYLFDMAPDMVSANGAGYIQPGIEDVVFVNLHFPDGRSAQIHVSWLDPHKERKLVLVGSKTMVVFDDMSPMETIRVYNKGAVVPEASNGPTPVTVRHGDILIPQIPSAEPLMTECQHFIDAIRNGTTPRSDGRDGQRVVRVLEAADTSLKAGGQPVKLENMVPSS
jgi:predicted dehydrogenase